MPSERFRDPITGRWVRREVAQSSGFDFVREIFEGNRRTDAEVYREGETEGLFGRAAVPNWIESDVPWGTVWSTQDYANGKPYGGIETLNLDALDEAEYPGGQYRVIFSVPDNPDYPRGYASTGALMGDQWPPRLSMGANAGATGIIAVHFYQY